MNEKASHLVVSLAKNFIDFLQSNNPGWAMAYFRFCFSKSHSDANASYVLSGAAFLISALKNPAFFNEMSSNGEDLIKSLSKEEGVFLLTVDSSFNYEIKYEWLNFNRWKITKMDGGSGIPLEA
jgi:hypothetical protein